MLKMLNFHHVAGFHRWYHNLTCFVLIADLLICEESQDNMIQDMNREHL